MNKTKLSLFFIIAFIVIASSNFVQNSSACLSLFSDFQSLPSCPSNCAENIPYTAVHDVCCDPHGDTMNEDCNFSTINRFLATYEGGTCVTDACQFFEFCRGGSEVTTSTTPQSAFNDSLAGDPC